MLGEKEMIKNLVKHGNSWAVVIDRPILDLLKIAPDSQVELTTDGKSIRIAPVDFDDRKSRIHAARAKVNKAFKKLAE
jgi:antitoxin component of MazEF toxin-antitoxin module